MMAMPHMLLYDRHKEELTEIRDWVSTMSNLQEELLIFSAGSLQDLLRRLRDMKEISVCCADFEAEGEQAVYAVKGKDPTVIIVVIAGRQVSPVVYVRPGIMAAGILLRPLEKKQVTDMLCEVLEMMDMRTREKLFNDEVFVFTTREGTIRVPYSQVLYFEARNKKIYLCTKRTEMDFYSTLDGILQKVPEYFLRCHKGFIVNQRFVTRVDLKENRLHMVGGVQLPISRSYREEVKEALL